MADRRHEAELQLHAVSWASHTQAQQHVSTRALAPTTCRLATVEEVRLRGRSRAKIQQWQQQQSFSPRREAQKRVCSAQHRSPRRLCLVLAAVASGRPGRESNPATADRKSRSKASSNTFWNDQYLHLGFLSSGKP